MNSKSLKLQNDIKRVHTPSTIYPTNSDSLNSQTTHNLSKLQKSQNLPTKSEMVKQFDKQLKKSIVHCKYCDYQGKLNHFKKHMKILHPKEFCEVFDEFIICLCCKQVFKNKNLDNHIDKCIQQTELKTKRQMKEMVLIKQSIRIAKEDEYSEQEYQQDINILRYLLASDTQEVDSTSAILQQMEVEAVQRQNNNSSTQCQEATNCINLLEI